MLGERTGETGEWTGRQTDGHQTDALPLSARRDQSNNHYGGELRPLPEYILTTE